MKTESSPADLRSLVERLESCAETVRGLRNEVERGLAQIEAALDAARSFGAVASPAGVEALLEAHHDRLARLVGARGAAAVGNEGEFPFRMDPQQRVARIGRRRIPLTPSEFQVLELLWEQMPAPVSRRALLHHLYGGRDETTESVIDMFIFKIRQKLKGAGCSDASIKGIRGVGWVLELGEVEDASAEIEAATDPE